MRPCGCFGPLRFGFLRRLLAKRCRSWSRGREFRQQRCPVRTGIIEQLLKYIRRITLTEPGAVQHGFRPVVYERRARDTACGVLPENGVDAVGFQQAHELVLRPGAVHGAGHGSTNGTLNLLGFDVGVVSGDLLLQELVAAFGGQGLGFDRCADPLALFVGRGVDDAVPPLAVGFALAFLQIDIIEVQQGSELGDRAEPILLGQKPHGGLHLLFEVVASVLDPAGRVELPLLIAFDGGPQAVSAFDGLQRIHGTAAFEIMVEFTTIFINPHRYDMYMLAVDVAVFEYIVGLVAEAHALHVLAGNLRKLGIGQTVGDGWIQRYVEYGIFCAAIYGQIGRETLHCIREVETVGALHIYYPIA